MAELVALMLVGALLWWAGSWFFGRSSGVEAQGAPGFSAVKRQRQAQGFDLLYVDAAYTADGHVPPHSTLLLKIAPLERELAAFALAPPDGSPPAYFATSNLQSLHVYSNGASFFGFGPSAIVATSIASSLDRMLAGWSIEICTHGGEIIQATKLSGPPPVQDLVRLRSRLARVGLDDDDPSPFSARSQSTIKASPVARRVNDWSDLRDLLVAAFKLTSETEPRFLNVYDTAHLSRIVYGRAEVDASEHSAYNLLLDRALRKAYLFSLFGVGRHSEGGFGIGVSPQSSTSGGVSKQYDHPSLRAALVKHRFQRRSDGTFSGQILTFPDEEGAAGFLVSLLADAEISAGEVAIAQAGYAGGPPKYLLTDTLSSP
jgi:hypothetical protein